MKTIFSKPSNVSYTDMCIYIDNHIHDENADLNKIYIYMWLLAFMMACKKKYFDTREKYEEFASYLAYDVFTRMLSTEGSKIKSVKNYMTKVLYWRKCEYESQQHTKIFEDYDYTGEKTGWCSTSYAEKQIQAVESQNRELIASRVVEIISLLPGVIDKRIPRVYKRNTVLRNNIYHSSVLSILNQFTLPDIQNTRLLNASPDTRQLDEIKFYRRFLRNDIILWHLPEEYEGVVKIVVNKTMEYFKANLKDVIQQYKLSHEEYNDISNSTFNSNGENYEYNY